MPDITNIELSADHPIPIEPLGGAVTVKVTSNGPVYYSDSQQVSSANNQGSISNGASQTFTSQVWIIGAAGAASGVQLTVFRGSTSGGNPTDVVLGSDGLIGGPGGTGLTSTVISDSSAPAGKASFNYAVIREAPLNVQWAEYGAKGDGTTDDTAAIQAALNAVFQSASAGALPHGGTVLIPNTHSKYMISAPLLVPESVVLKGMGHEATVLMALPSFSGAAMVQNKATDGTQEAIYIEDMAIHGNAGSATVPVGVLLDSLFIPTTLQRLWVQHCSGKGVHIKCTANTPFGPIFLDRIWSSSHGDDLILVEGAMQNVEIQNCNVEFPASGHHCLHLKGSGNTAGGMRATVTNLFGQNNVNGCATILIEDYSGVLVDGVYDSLIGLKDSTTALVRITGTNQWPTNAQHGARGIELRSLHHLGGPGGPPLVDDQTRSRQVLANQFPAFLGHYYSGAGDIPTINGTPNTPTVSASDADFANPFPSDAIVYITADAGGACAVKIKGGTTTLMTIPAGGIATLHWPAGISYRLTYTSAPTWVWVTR